MANKNTLAGSIIISHMAVRTGLAGESDTSPELPNRQCLFWWTVFDRLCRLNSDFRREPAKTLYCLAFLTLNLIRARPDFKICSTFDLFQFKQKLEFYSPKRIFSAFLGRQLMNASTLDQHCSRNHYHRNRLGSQLPLTKSLLLGFFSANNVAREDLDKFYSFKSTVYSIQCIVYIVYVVEPVERP